MKNIFCLIVATTICYSIQAQKIYIQGGVNLANITKDLSENNNMLTTFNAGILARVKIAGIVGFETGLLLTGHGSKAETIFFTNGNDQITKIKSTFNPVYLELPLNLIIKIGVCGGPSFFINAGPYVAMGAGGKAKVETSGGIAGTIKSESKIEFAHDNPIIFEQDDAAYNKLKRFDYGVNLGGGMNFKKIILKANYGFGLANINSTQSIFNADNKNKYRTISFSVGIPLGL